MATAENEQDQRAEDAEAQGAGGGSHDGEGSQLGTVAKVAAAGALVGTAIAAARAAGSRGGESSDDTGADDDDAATAERDTKPEETQTPAEPEPSSDEPAREPTAGDAPEQAESDSASDERAEGNGASDERSEEPSFEVDDGVVGGVIERAVRQVSDLAGHPAAGVLGFKKREGGWTVDVELVELVRIPPTTDVLGVYEVQVDDDGAIQQYRRTRRYVRSQADASEES